MQNIERIESTNSRLSRPLTVKRVEGRKEGRKEGRACPVAERNRDRQIARQYFFFLERMMEKYTHIFFLFVSEKREFGFFVERSATSSSFDAVSSE